MENIPHRIKVNIRTGEFEAEGGQKFVEDHYSEFLKAMAAAPPKAAAPPVVETPAPLDSGVVPPQVADMDPSLSAAIDRVFRRGDVLSLMATPKGDTQGADALVILLYGYNKLLNEPAVTGVSLMKSMQQSGVRVERIDRAIEAKSEFVNAAGFKRGRRYSLNNRGLQEAEKLIRGLIE